MAIIGIGGVVIVFVAVLSIAEGFRSAMQGTGDPRTVIVMRSGSDTEMTSGFSGEEARLITEAPGIERGPDGVHASPELFVIIGHPLKRSGTDANVPLRGLTPIALQVRPELQHRRRAHVHARHVRDRRRPRGVAAVQQPVAGIDRASRARCPGRSSASSTRAAASPSPSCGAMPACCRAPISAATRISRSTCGSRRVDSLQQLKDALTTDPRLNVTVVREPDYYAQQSQVLQTIIRTIGIGIAVLMGLGAVFGAVNTMYSAVAARTREIATLRALGFGSMPVVVSVLAEALLLSLIGGALGGLVAWAGVRRLSDRHHELAVVQPGRVRVRGDPRAAAAGADLRGHSWGCSAVCCRPSAPPASPS